MIEKLVNAPPTAENPVPPTQVVGGGVVAFAGALEQELLAWLDQQPITSSNIGEYRRRLLMPWNSRWNAIVRDETAARENVTIKA